MSFQEQMLNQTFELSRLALNNAVLLNGAAATALLAFLGLAAPHAREPLTTAVIWFGSGAGLAGWASVFAYVGQRFNWESSKYDDNPTDEHKRRNWMIAAKVLIYFAAIVCLAAFTAFVVGAVLAGNALPTTHHS
jgi:hypothetical protein